MKYLLRILLAALCAAVAATGCNREPGKPATPHKSAGSTVLATTTILATIGENEKPVTISMPSAAIHSSPTTQLEFTFSEKGGGVAYTIEKNGEPRVVHNGKAGTSCKAVGAVVLSPDGKRIAYGVLVDGKWRMVVDGKEGAPFNAVQRPVFSPDGSHLAYQAMAGERWYLVVDTKPNPGTDKRYLNHEFSADSSRIAYIDNVDDKNRGRLVVSDLAFAKQIVIAAGVSSMFSNTDKSRIAAVSTSDGKQQVVDFSFDWPDAVHKGALYDTVGPLAFGPDGATLAYTAQQAGRRVLVLGDRELALPQGDLAGLPVIHPDNKTVGVLMFSDGATFLQQLSPGGGNREDGYESAESLVYSRDGRYHAYAAQKGPNWFVVVNGKEGPAFDRVVSPLFTPDGKLVVYRARKDGKRFVVVADPNGRTIRQYPPYEQVFQPVFTADGKSVAYGVKDGNKLIWKVDPL